MLRALDALRGCGDRVRRRAREEKVCERCVLARCCGRGFCEMFADRTVSVGWLFSQIKPI